MIFKEYVMTPYKSNNDGYFKKLKKLGFAVNQSLPQISFSQVRDFLNTSYNDLKPSIVPIASCSMVAGSEALKKMLEKEFQMKVKPVYGFIQVKEQTFHKFTDSDINSALNQNKYFDNHHAWFQFENGQLLDLVFINTVKHVKKIEEDLFEFVLTNASSIYIPEVMNIMYTQDQNSFFKYIPMYLGNLFSQELLIEKCPVKFFD